MGSDSPLIEIAKDFWIESSRITGVKYATEGHPGGSVYKARVPGHYVLVLWDMNGTSMAREWLEYPSEEPARIGVARIVEEVNRGRSPACGVVRTRPTPEEGEREEMARKREEAVLQVVIGKTPSPVVVRCVKCGMRIETSESDSEWGMACPICGPSFVMQAIPKGGVTP